MRQLRTFLCILILFPFAAGLGMAQAPERPQMPPEIQRILQKVQSGQKPTPEEQKALREWGKSLASKMGREKTTPPGLINPLATLGVCPAADQTRNLLSRVPTREAFLAQVKSAAQIYGAKAGTAHSRIDALLKVAARDRDGSNLGAALVMMRAGSAAVYATTWSAMRNPNDAVTANNLGLLLKGMKDYPRALQTLLYADSLKPNMPVTITNLAWIYYDLGDASKARGLFERAAALNPKLSGPHMGLGLLAECSGDHKLAAKELRQSLHNGYSSLAENALDFADTALEKSGNQDKSTAPPDNGTGVGDPPASGNGLTLPDPPVSAEVPEMAASANALAEMYVQAVQQDVSAKQEMIAEGAAVRDAMKRISNMEISGGSATVYRNYDMERFLMKDLYRIFIVNKVKPAYEAFHKEASGLSDDFASRMVRLAEQLQEEARACGNDYECERRAEKEFCRQKRTLAEKKNYNPEFAGAWNQYWGAAKPALNDYYGFADSALANVRNPVLSKMMNLEREVHILDEYSGSLAFPKMWASAMLLAWSCQPTPQAPPKPNANVVEKEAEKCPIPPLFFGLGMFKLYLDCEKFKIQGGEGIIGYIEKDFGKQDMHFFIGVGAEASSGVGVGPEVKLLEGELKAGFRLDIENGEFKDLAMEASGDVQVGPFRVGSTADIAMESGPNLQSEVHLGGSLQL